MRIYCMALLMGLACATWADRINAGVYWPRWRIQTGEDKVSSRYPLSNMADGRLDTAWVYNKTLHAHQESEPQPFHHGKRKEIWLRNQTGSSVTLDGIGITNGYTKDSPTYWRNNRIRTITLSLWGDDRAQVTQSFTLQDTRALQHCSFPRISARQMTLRVEAVDPGQDDDLCISELVFFTNGRPLDWELTPFVFSNDSSQSCCGGTSFAVRTQGGLRLTDPDGKPLTVAAFACQPGKPIALLGSRTALYLFDLQRGAYFYQRDVPGQMAALGWLDANTAAIALYADGLQDWEHITWHTIQIDRSLTWTNAPQPLDPDSFRPGVEGPWYAA
jgi:hypothetical protein